MNGSQEGVGSVAAVVRASNDGRWQRIPFFRERFDADEGLVREEIDSLYQLAPWVGLWVDASGVPQLMGTMSMLYAYERSGNRLLELGRGAHFNRSRPGWRHVHGTDGRIPIFAQRHLLLPDPENPTVTRPELGWRLVDFEQGVQAAGQIGDYLYVAFTARDGLPRITRAAVDELVAADTGNWNLASRLNVPNAVSNFAFSAPFNLENARYFELNQHIAALSATGRLFISDGRTRFAPNSHRSLGGPDMLGLAAEGLNYYFAYPDRIVIVPQNMGSSASTWQLDPQQTDGFSLFAISSDQMAFF
ncbi:MAG: hypothetical protein LR015_00475 [Verrucomicrobia bacterium]|nr:hypothetical protein [Verrucomicrobiota bacterium]